MSKVDYSIVHYFLDYVLWHLKILEKSILCYLTYFSSKFGLELPKVCIHTCFIFGILLKKYVGESIVQT